MIKILIIIKIIKIILTIKVIAIIITIIIKCRGRHRTPARTNNRTPCDITEWLKAFRYYQEELPPRCSEASIYMYINVSCYGSIPLTSGLIGRDGGLSTLCHSCGFACQQRVLKTFPGPSHLHSEDGVV